MEFWSTLAKNKLLTTFYPLHNHIFGRILLNFPQKWKTCHFSTIEFSQAMSWIWQRSIWNMLVDFSTFYNWDFSSQMFINKTTFIFKMLLLQTSALLSVGWENGLSFLEMVATNWKWVDNFFAPKKTLLRRWKRRRLQRRMKSLLYHITHQVLIDISCWCMDFLP